MILLSCTLLDAFVNSLALLFVNLIDEEVSVRHLTPSHLTHTPLLSQPSSDPHLTQPQAQPHPIHTPIPIPNANPSLPRPA